MKKINFPSLHINTTTIAVHIILLITLVMMKTVTANVLDEEVQNKFLISKSDHFHVRTKRNENLHPSEYLNEYYANYYNEYYNNYYNNNNRFTNFYNNAAPSRISTISSVGSFDDNSNLVLAHGTKYTYKPIFKYRSTATHKKRHKLFVPV